MKKIKGILAVIGLVLVLGAAGSEQISAIEFFHAMKVCFVGLALMILGVW